MKTLLRWLWNRNRDTFDDFYVTDMIGEIPHEVSEESLKFLLTGKRQLDRWFRWNAYVLQRKLQQPSKHAQTYIGGLIFIQTLALLLNRIDNGKELMKETPEPIVTSPDINDSMQGVDDFFSNLKKADG